MFGAPCPYLVGVDGPAGGGAERRQTSRRVQCPVVAVGRATEYLHIPGVAAVGLTDDDLHHALTVVGEEQRLADLELLDSVPIDGWLRGGPCRSCHLEVRRRRDKGGAEDAMMVEEGRPRGAERALEDVVLEGGGLDGHAEERVRTAGLARPVGPGGVGPIPLALERIGREGNDRTASRAHGGPVERGTGGVEVSRRRQDLAPLVLTGPQRR